MAFAAGRAVRAGGDAGLPGDPLTGRGRAPRGRPIRVPHGPQRQRGSREGDGPISRLRRRSSSKEAAGRPPPLRSRRSGGQKALKPPFELGQELIQRRRQRQRDLKHLALHQGVVALARAGERLAVDGSREGLRWARDAETERGGELTTASLAERRGSGPELALPCSWVAPRALTRLGSRLESVEPILQLPVGPSLE